MDRLTLVVALLTYHSAIARVATTIVFLPSLVFMLGVRSNQWVVVSTFNFALELTTAQFSTIVR